MANYYEIKIGDNDDRVISINETTSREIEISGHVYVVPAGVITFIKELSDEIVAVQQRKVATDKQIDEKINKRIDRMIKELSARGILAKPLDEECPLPDNMVLDNGTWTFMDEARIAAREGLKNEWRDDLVDDLGSPYTSPPRK